MTQGEALNPFEGESESNEGTPEICSLNRFHSVPLSGSPPLEKRLRVKLGFFGRALDGRQL